MLLSADTPPLRLNAGRPLQVALLLAGLLAAAAAAAMDSEPSAAELAALVAGLGDADYNQREAAAARLNALGPAAVDALLAAAEVSDDLEVALRARWLVDTIPLSVPQDSAEVAKLLDRFKRRSLAERVQVMHRLLRIENDAGIEPLARIVRLDRSPTGSRVAAALLSREWQPDEPAWKAMCPRIIAGLGGSSRPAAAFLSSVVAFSQSQDPQAGGRAVDAAAVTLSVLSRAGGDEPRGEPNDAVGAAADVSSDLSASTFRIFQRCLVQMLLAAGRRDEAVAEAGRMLAACLAAEQDPEAVDAGVADVLVWSKERGVPEIVDRLAAARPGLIDERPLVGYAAALCERARNAQPQAEKLAAQAFHNPQVDFADRLQAAILLAKWGGVDWAAREYTAVIDDPQTPAAQFALAAIMFSEFLHDQEREDEAATCLRRLVEGPGKNGGKNGEEGNESILQRLGRDPRSIRSRMHYFESCAAATRGDATARRRAIEDSLRSYPKDVDALIALHGMPDNTPAQRAQAVARINEALAQIDGEIQAVPDDANGYNEYAWLVSNTEGDIQKATRYSKLSLVKSFDNSSYLDTLAHCHAAAGDLPAAIRTQRLAQRQEPHNRTIARNLEQFRRAAAGR